MSAFFKNKKLVIFAAAIVLALVAHFGGLDIKALLDAANGFADQIADLAATLADDPSPSPTAESLLAFPADPVPVQ